MLTLLNKFHVRNGIVAVIFLTSYSLSNAQLIPNNIQQEILNTEKEIAEAVVKTDTAKVAQLLSDSYTFTLFNGTIIRKKKFLADMVQWWHPLSIIHSNQQVTIYSTTAVCIGKATYKWLNETGGEEITVEQYTDTYIKRNKKWIRISSHVSCLSGRCG